MTNNIILQARGLKKYYGKGETQVRALDGVDLDIERACKMVSIMVPPLHHLRSGIFSLALS